MIKKHHLLITIVFGIFLTGTSLAEEIKEYDEEGRVSQISNYNGDVPDGDWTSFYENGQIREKKAYVMGKLSGPAEFFYESGFIMDEGFYQKGMPHGVWKTFHENGKVKEIVYYINGVRQGEWKMFDSAGRVLEEGSYKSGRRMNVKRYKHESVAKTAESQETQ